MGCYSGCGRVGGGEGEGVEWRAVEIGWGCEGGGGWWGGVGGRGWTEGEWGGGVGGSAECRVACHFSVFISY